MVGSLFGIVLCNKVEMVKRTYANLNFERPNITSQQVDDELMEPYREDGPIGVETAEGDKEQIKDENSINLNTVKKILIFWGLTVPVAMFVAYSITALLLINVNGK